MARRCGPSRPSRVHRCGGRRDPHASSILRESASVRERDGPLDWRDAGHYGAAATGVVLAEATIECAWNVQGDIRRVAFAGEAQRVFGAALPSARNTIARTDGAT